MCVKCFAFLLHFAFGVLFSDNPICIPFEDCYWESALLISRSFLGEFSYYYEDTWLLHAGPKRYISLLFDDFDIGCETGTLLDIEFTKDTRLNYCNKNRPIERLTSIENQLTVLFRLNRVAYFLMEGFSARYKTIEQLQPDAMELANETICKLKFKLIIRRNLDTRQLFNNFQEKTHDRNDN